jgi:hypothetical protein
MFDPYAAALVPVQLQEGFNVVPPREGQNGAPRSDNPPALMGCLGSLLDDFDFGSSERSAMQHTCTICLAGVFAVSERSQALDHAMELTLLHNPPADASGIAVCCM